MASHKGIGATQARFCRRGPSTIVVGRRGPDGWVNEESINIDSKFFRDRGQINGEATPDQVLDRSLADASVKTLGSYKRLGQ